VSEIPASVHIVTRKDIERYGWRTLAEVIRNIPGFYTIYDYREDIVGLRGVLNESNLLFLVNGVVQNTSAINEIMMPAEAIDRIEVVRGPMSVIYGSGAFLGSVNIVTNHIPYGEPLSMVSGSLGFPGVYEAFARASGEKDHFRYTLNASTYHSDGPDEDYRDMMSPGGWEALDPDARVSTGGLLERENNNFNLSAGYKDFYADIQYNGVKRGTLDQPTQLDIESVSEIEIAAVQLGWRRDLSRAFQIDGKISFCSKNRYEEELSDNPIGPIENVMSAIKGKENFLEMELDLVWKPSDAFSMISGVNYSTILDASHDLILTDASDSFPGWTYKLGSYDVTDQVVYAFFTQINYKPFERFKLTAGVRVEWNMQFNTSLTLGSFGQDVTVPISIYNEGGKTYFIPRVAAVYTPGERHFIKLMYGEAIKPISFVNLDLVNTNIPNTLGWIRRELEPERIRTIELNYLYSLPNLGIGLNLFRNDIENLESPSLKDESKRAGMSLPDYSGRVETHGVELILAGRPVKPLELGFSATWQRSRDKSNQEDGIAYSPKLLLKGRCGYQWREFTIAATGLYVDTMDPAPLDAGGDESGDGGGESGPESADAYFIANLNFRYEHEKTGLFAAARVSNLFDEDVRTPVSADVEIPNGLIDEGRAFTATVGWKF
ncbi:MAG: TonB-dependent receptor, partial [Desulfobacterales bacterium]|nr:TonB-dependent receptor [Desulfobacterales bacterium]